MSCFTSEGSCHVNFPGLVISRTHQKSGQMSFLVCISQNKQPRHCPFSDNFPFQAKDCHCLLMASLLDQPFQVLRLCNCPLPLHQPPATHLHKHQPYTVSAQYLLSIRIHSVTSDSNSIGRSFGINRDR